ncbi:SufD family Fe-S cluster assembly protein [Candidatus Babeliales bacterium]|nr:SufD family Fe-S cluster assembly protein [Candidatus Babeliales bacterium]
MVKEIVIKKNEQLTLHLKADDSFTELHIYIEENAHLIQTLLFTGQQKYTFIQKIYLQGRGATAKVQGAVIAGESEQYTISTEQIHTAPDTQSEVHFYGIIGKDASCSYNGLITLKEGSLRAVADQQNKVLLLHETAKAFSVPSIQALHDDVSCGHGAAISYLDKEHLFFLMGRGISEKQAEKILIKGFLPSFASDI